MTFITSVFGNAYSFEILKTLGFGTEKKSQNKDESKLMKPGRRSQRGWWCNDDLNPRSVCAN
ncbi:hypothetical protein RYX36_008784 [Vicia faba]